MYSKGNNKFNTIKEVTDNLKSKYENGYLIGGGYGSNGLVVYDKNNPKVKRNDSFRKVSSSLCRYGGKTYK